MRVQAFGFGQDQRIRPDGGDAGGIQAQQAWCAS